MNRKLAFLAALVLFLVPIAAGCHMVVYNEDEDRNQVVAILDGEEILKSPIIDNYEAYKSYAYIDEDSENTEYGRSIAKKLKMGYLEEIIEDKILEKKFIEYDIAELTDDEMAELQQQVDDYVVELESVIEIEMETIREAYPDYTDEKVRDQAEYNVLQKYGISDGTFLADLVVQRRQEMLLDLALKEDPLSDDELKAWYDENLTEQKEKVDEAINNYAVYSADSVALYCSRDRYYVREIQVDYYKDIRSEVADLRAEGKREEAEALLEEERAKAEEKINEAYAKLQAGADFKEMVLEYSDDKYSKEEYFLENGFETYNGMRARPKVWVAATLKLENSGDITEPIYNEDNCYYILQLVKVTPAGEIPFETVKEDIHSLLYAEARNEAYHALLEEWKKEYGLKIFENRLYN